MADMKTARPLSPHLQVYRMTLTMAMSIMHRITGMAISGGMLLLVWWLSAAAVSDSYFDTVQWLFGSIIGRIVLLGLSWALIHHALGGLRHLLWDTAHGFELPRVEWMAKANLIGSIALTLLLWVVAYGVRP